MCDEKLNQFTIKQDGAKQVAVVVDLENSLFAKFDIAERSHFFTESRTAYVENFSSKVHLLQNGNLQMRQTYFAESKHELQVSSLSFDVGFEKFNFFLQEAIFSRPQTYSFLLS